MPKVVRVLVYEGTYEALMPCFLHASVPLSGIRAMNSQLIISSSIVSYEDMPCISCGKSIAASQNLLCVDCLEALPKYVEEKEPPNA